MQRVCGFFLVTMDWGLFSPTSVLAGLALWTLVGMPASIHGKEARWLAFVTLTC